LRVARLDDTFGGSRSQVRDFDGDGYADHVALTPGNDAAVTVNLKRRGKTNLLKTISRPLGATIALDYVRSGNTTDLPQNRWVMASRTVFDGLAGDGADFQIATFDYQNGQWSRAERTFYGFAQVTEQQRDTTGVTTVTIGTTTPTSLPVLRSIIESFRTDSFYTKGLLASQVTQDGAGNRFLETDNTYNVVTVTLALPASTTSPTSASRSSLSATSCSSKARRRPANRPRRPSPMAASAMSPTTPTSATPAPPRCSPPSATPRAPRPA
jgi:hypothetical protein